MKKLQPNVKEIERFKKFIHKQKSTVFQIFSEKGKEERKPEVLYGTYSSSINKLSAAAQAGMAVTMMINEGKSRKAADVAKIKAFFVDFDKGCMTLKDLLRLPIEPHLVNETSPGNFHAFWLVEGCQLAQFKPVMQALAKKLGTDPAVCDLSRTMRIPGTYNNKGKTPFLVKTVHDNKDAKPIKLSTYIKQMGLKVGLPKDVISNTEVESVSVKPMSDKRLAEIEEALTHVSPENRQIWMKVMMAIHSEAPNEVGYKLFTTWAKKSDKYAEAENRKNWNKLKVGGGVTIKSLFWLAKLAQQGTDETFDESSLAKLLVELYKDKLRYCSDTEQWYFFNGVVWVTDSQAPIRCAREMTHGLCSGKDGAKISKTIKTFLTVPGFKSISKHAELLPEVQIGTKEFDENPDLLAAQNGVIDLRTGEFRQAVPSDYLRRQAKVVFDDDAKCPEWMMFMKAVTKKDKQLYYFIRRVLGYILFGRADQQVFFLILGTGSNGKGVLMRILKALLGEYAIAVAPNLLTSAYGGNANSPSPALAALLGARFVICTELNGKKLDAGFVKQYAGGDEITARHGYGDIFTFKPEGKLVISANYEDLPEIAANDEAMWRRLVPIPFNAVFKKGENDDSELEERLAGEFPGILNWLIKGAVDYHQIGLKQKVIENRFGICAVVDAKKAELRMEADSILAWMSDCCKVDPKSKTQASHAYVSYVTFMNNTVRKELSVQAFCAGLERKNFFRKATSKNNWYEGFSIRK